jgi:hypothetical protein
MRISSTSILRVTGALRRPETAVAAAEFLRGATGRAEVEGLVELVYQPPAARAAVTAITALEAATNPIVLDALGAALANPHASVRAAAAQALHRRRTTHCDEELARLLEGDESWVIRRAALAALAHRPGPDRWRVLVAATDPHWRVRHALARLLADWGDSDTQRQEIDDRLARAGPNTRVEGVREYLHYRWSGRRPAADSPRAADPGPRWHFWDADPAVLLRNLERLDPAGRRQVMDAMPVLLGHADERVRGQAVDALRAWGEPRHLAQSLMLLDEPRIGAAAAVAKLLASLDLDRAEEAARFVRQLPRPSPAQLAWVLDQAGVSLPIEEVVPDLVNQLLGVQDQPLRVRGALARLAVRWEDPDADRLLQRLLDDPDPGVQLEALRGLRRQPRMRLDTAALGRLLNSRHAGLRAEAVLVAVEQDADRSLIEALADDPDARVRIALSEGLAGRGGAEDDLLLARLQADPHPHVRAAALTPARAAELTAEPDRETSWHVLAKAARLRRVPLWELEPENPWQPGPGPPPAAGPLHLGRPTPPHARLLGPGKLVVAPLGISGHYGLPVEGFVRAVEAGVNLLFWEPNYQTLTDFLGRLPAADRNALHLVTGTFEADGQRVRRDAERALRVLGIDRLAVFLVFWVQSWDRVSVDVREVLERLKAEGKVAAYGLSTHARPLAVEALAAGWDPVMVRHSAAHRGAEGQIFPRAVERGASVITFNNTCYGRLLQPRGELPPPGAADCYRFTLAQPGVRACWSAPVTLAQLAEDLTALHAPDLPPVRRERLLAQGELVYQEDAIFRELIRSR